MSYAWRHTAIGKREVAGGAASALIALLALSLMHAKPAVLWEVAVVAGAGLVGAAMVSTSEFLWRLVTAASAILRNELAEARSTTDTLKAKVAELEAVPTPHLGFVGTEIDNDARVLIRHAGGTSMVNATMSWARVRVANDPGDALGALAQHVVATVRFFDAGGLAEFFHIDGRWAEAPQAPELQRMGLSKEGRELDIAANADPHALDIAMKYVGDRDCFAWNNDNGREAPDGRLARHKLTSPIVRVQVVLRGTNVPRTEGWFTLKNLAPDQPLALEEWSSP